MKQWQRSEAVVKVWKRSLLCTNMKLKNLRKSFLWSSSFLWRFKKGFLTISCPDPVISWYLALDRVYVQEIFQHICNFSSHFPLFPFFILTANVSRYIFSHTNMYTVPIFSSDSHQKKVCFPKMLNNEQSIKVKCTHQETLKRQNYSL